MTITSLLFVSGLALLVAGAELLVREARRPAQWLGVSPLVAGLTVVAFGTSAPELAVTVLSVWGGEPDLAVGNVVGSNIANVLLILGLSAAIAPLVVNQKLVQWDVPLMIGASLLAWALAADGVISRGDGVMLVAGFVAYMMLVITLSRREKAAVRAEYAVAIGDTPERLHRTLARDAGLIAGGLGLLALGAHWIVGGAVAFATAMGVSELVVGLTVVAVGTSLPELAASVVASMRGERDIAAGNAVGSCLFNLLLVLGLAAAIAPEGVAVSPSVLAQDIPLMVLAAAACLPIFAHGHAILRWEGVLFLAYFGAYVIYQVLFATASPAIVQFRLLMWGFVLPLSAVTFAVLLVRIARQRRPSREG